MRKGFVAQVNCSTCLGFGRASGTRDTRRNNNNATLASENRRLVFIRLAERPGYP